jgi:hypothetical protein
MQQGFEEKAPRAREAFVPLTRQMDWGKFRCRTISPELAQQGIQCGPFDQQVKGDRDKD